jgi:hypothetical protein
MMGLLLMRDTLTEYWRAPPQIGGVGAVDERMRRVRTVISLRQRGGIVE